MLRAECQISGEDARVHGMSALSSMQVQGKSMQFFFFVEEFYKFGVFNL